MKVEINSILDLYYEISYQIMRMVLRSNDIWTYILVIGSIILLLFTIIYITIQMINGKEARSFCNWFWILVNCSFLSFGSILYWIIEKIICSKRRTICMFSYKKIYLVPIGVGYIFSILIGFFPSILTIPDFHNYRFLSICVFSMLFVTIIMIVEMIILLAISTKTRSKPYSIPTTNEFQEKSNLHDTSENIKQLKREDFDEMLLLNITIEDDLCKAEYVRFNDEMKVYFPSYDYKSIILSFISSVIAEVGLIFPVLLYYIFL